MSTIRLFILGKLDQLGPTHGHRLRHLAQTERTELWTDIRVGSLYGALKRLAGEGLIRPVTTEREGNRPERTIYEITEAGHDEFVALRETILRELAIAPDPVDMALSLSADLPPEELRDVIEYRRDALAAQQAYLRTLRKQADPHLTPMERIIFGHLVTRVDADLLWHTDVLDTFDADPES